MKRLVLLSLILNAYGQNNSSHSGWNFTDTLQTATDIMVADVTGGSAVADGSQVTVKATLHTVRVLGGSTAPGASLALQWQYRPGPLEGPGVTTKVPQARGLWFLRRNPQGVLEPLPTGLMGPMGGSFLPLTAR